MGLERLPCSRRQFGNNQYSSAHTRVKRQTLQVKKHAGGGALSKPA
jgi:hypothetical protein